MKRHSRKNPLPSRLRAQKPNRRNAKSGSKRRAVTAWVGRDLAPLHRAEERRRRLLPVVLIGTLIAALGLTALRIDLIRQRYALAAAMSAEKQLVEEQRILTAKVRSLRDPARLAALADERGFVRPASVIQLPSREVQPSNSDVLRGRILGSDVALGPRP